MLFQEVIYAIYYILKVLLPLQTNVLPLTNPSPFHQRISPIKQIVFQFLNGKGKNRPSKATSPLPIILIPAIIRPALLLGQDRGINEASLWVDLIDEILSVLLQKVLHISIPAVLYNDHYFSCKTMKNTIITVDFI